MNSQVAPPRSNVRPIALALAWCGSVASLAAGIIMFFLAKTEATTVQVDANSGAITDPAEYYGRLASAEGLSGLSVSLISVGVLALILCLLATALSARQTLPVVALSSAAAVADDDSTPDVEIAEPVVEVLESAQAEDADGELVTDSELVVETDDEDEKQPTTQG